MPKGKGKAESSSTGVAKEPEKGLDRIGSPGAGAGGLALDRLLAQDEDKSPALAAMETLYQTLSSSKASTMSELREELLECVNSMGRTEHSSASIASASELFIRFISLASLDSQEGFGECKALLLERGRAFLGRAAAARTRISQLALPFLADGAVLLTHSLSRVVLGALLAAHAAGRRFSVFHTQSLPDNSGLALKRKLDAAGIPNTLILDGAVGYVMERVDAVLLGAEGVMETGGVINKIGSFTIAVCAKAMHKPLYVLAESYKFVKAFPLSQQDIPDAFKYKTSTLDSGLGVEKEHPLVDYTPADYIKLLFTDLGLLTPAAVSDELIKLYL